DLLVEGVKPFRRRRLLGDVEHLRGAELELCRKLIRGDARLQAGIALAARLMFAIELVEQSEAVGLALPGDVVILCREEVENWILRTRPNHRFLIGGGQKAGAP